MFGKNEKLEDKMEMVSTRLGSHIRSLAAQVSDLRKVVEKMDPRAAEEVKIDTGSALVVCKDNEGMVFFGYIDALHGDTVILRNVRKLYSKGFEVRCVYDFAVYGISDGKLSHFEVGEPVARLSFTGVTWATCSKKLQEQYKVLCKQQIDIQMYEAAERCLRAIPRVHKSY